MLRSIAVQVMGDRAQPISGGRNSFPKGGPDGGDGGRGGHIILRGNNQMWTLLHLRYRRHIFAGNGESGGAQQSTGADGEDILIEVPLGTIARKENSDEILFEITDHGDEKILAKGGRGGQGNTHFKSATNQTPTVCTTRRTRY